MRVISIFLGETEIARIEEGDVIKQMIEFKGFAKPDVRQWYEDCFYGIKNSSTFEQRFNLVEEHNYFCYSKPDLVLIARTLP